MERKGYTEITKEQNRALRAIARAGLEQGGRVQELKAWEVTDIGYGNLFVICETGGVNDEGTMAALLCRARGTFTVGPKGGIKTMKRPDEHATKTKLRYNPLIWGWD